jgi:hypothetical protein
MNMLRNGHPHIRGISVVFPSRYDEFCVGLSVHQIVAFIDLAHAAITQAYR